MEINNNNNNNNNYYYYYYFLPEEISINILSRLPTVSVISCSLVCKSWRNLIVNNREFPRMHLLRGLESHHGASAYNGRVNFLLQTYSRMKKGLTLYYTLDDDNYENAIPAFRALRSNPNPYNMKNYYVVGSCNGLICMAYNTGVDYSCKAYEQPMYICNPITREWLTLPSLTINDCCFSCSTNDNNDDDPIPVSNILRVVCGFGYLPSTDEYKVVRITYCFHGGSRAGRVQVYTLGDGTGWRNKGEITYFLTYYANLPSILANGALHWLEQQDERKIVAFDLADEEFLFLPSPPCFLPHDDNVYPFEIQVLGGKLCALHPKENLTVGMWFFKNKKEVEKNGNYKDGNGRPKFQSWSWIKEFDIERDLKAAEDFTPFILTEYGDVLYHSYKTLFCYDLKTATSKELVDMVKFLPSDFNHLSAMIPHLNSFFSLKALGEEDTKIIIV